MERESGYCCSVAFMAACWAKHKELHAPRLSKLKKARMGSPSSPTWQPRRRSGTRTRRALREQRRMTRVKSAKASERLREDTASSRRPSSTSGPRSRAAPPRAESTAPPRTTSADSCCSSARRWRSRARRNARPRPRAPARRSARRRATTTSSRRRLRRGCQDTSPLGATEPSMRRSMCYAGHATS